MDVSADLDGIGDNMKDGAFEQDAFVQGSGMDGSADLMGVGYDVKDGEDDAHDIQDGAFVQDALAQGDGMGGSMDLQGVGDDGKTVRLSRMPSCKAAAWTAARAWRASVMT